MPRITIKAEKVKTLIGVVLIVCGFIAGNYLQHNKAKVKKKIKEIVDKL